MNENAKTLSEMTLEELWQLFPVILSGYDPEWKNYYEGGKTLPEEIVFRDYLRRDPAKAQEYARLKMDLQKRFEHDRDAYTEAKGDFIRACVKEARARMGN